MKYDVAIFGAGIVGVSVALHLQAAGRSVVVIDRSGAAGQGTSYGNAGLVERASIIPYGFPRAIRDIVRYGLNRSVDARYHFSFLPKIAPFLFEYWQNSSPAGLASAASDLLPLIEGSVREHDAFMQDCGDRCNLFSRKGWLKAYRNEKGLNKAQAEAQGLDQYGVNWACLDRKQLAILEPALENFHGAIHWMDPITASDPGQVTATYAELFVSRGGSLVKGDAFSIRQTDSGWSADAANGVVEAGEAVIAMGPWSADILRPLGYDFPLAVKRGYHMHYRLQGGHQLHRPVLDASIGYLLAPMIRGIRLTTGVEMAPRDAPPTPVQLDQAEIHARQVIELGDRVDAQPWIGYRPVFADMRPVIGPALAHETLWLAFGHGHHGFTMGPGTGRLLMEMMTGRCPHVDPTPFSAARFQ